MAIAVKTAVDILKDIQSWPHWKEIGQVAEKEYKMSEEKYNSLLPEYQRFITLCCTGYHALGMFSRDVDNIWHSHILSTHRYHEFCNTYNNGELVHHIPQIGPKKGNICTACQSCKGCNATCKNCQGQAKPGEQEHNSLESFIRAYYTEFGEMPSSTIWNIQSADGIAE
jgi:hypothetical protein